MRYALALLALLAPAAAFAELPSGTLMTMDRGKCEGCASYHLDIMEDGKAVLTPRVTQGGGKRTKQLTEGELNQVKDQLADLRESLPKGGDFKKPAVQGAGVVTVEYRYEGKPQTLVYAVTDDAAPRVVESFVEAVEKLGGVEEWMAADPRGGNKHKKQPQGPMRPGMGMPRAPMGQGGK